MKKWILTVVLAALIVCPAGCESAVTPDQVKDLAGKVETLNSQIETYQTAANQIAAAVEATGLITPEQKAKLDQLQAEIDRVQPQIAAITSAVAAVRYSDGDTLQTILEAVQAGNAASAPWNPYSAVIGSVLALVSLVAGIFAKKKSAAASAAKTALNEVVMGNEIFKNKASPDAVAAFKDAQTLNQSEETTKAVAAIIA